MKCIVTYDTQHGSAKKLATCIGNKLGCLVINVDTPFQAEDANDYDTLICVFGFRGPYTAQLTKLFLEKMKGKLNYKNLIVVGEGIFSEKEFPSVADGLRAIATPYSFNKFFMKGQLRVATLTPEEKALLGKFAQLTGMVIEDMGEYKEESAEAIASDILKLTETLEIPVDPNAGKTRWICTVCGYVYEGEEAPEACPMCNQPKEKFKKM